MTIMDMIAITLMKKINLKIITLNQAKMKYNPKKNQKKKVIRMKKMMMICLRMKKKSTTKIMK